jgi:anti-sigma regulatory factor (Ser/Thr protein kinase)
MVLPPGRGTAFLGALSSVIDLVGRPESVSMARAFVRRTLGVDHPALEVVTLLTSEIVTNSVVHSDSRDGGAVRLAIADCPEFVCVEVLDAGGRMAPQMPQSGCGDAADAEGGRGLWLVERMASGWGTYADRGGRVVWFRVALG